MLFFALHCGLFALHCGLFFDQREILWMKWIIEKKEIEKMSRKDIGSENKRSTG